MKFLLFLMAFSITAYVCADVRVVKSEITGTGTELPNGIFQILDPKLTIGNLNLYLYTAKETPRTACAKLNMNYVSHQEQFLAGNIQGAIFDENGALSILAYYRTPGIDVPELSRFIYILTCRKAN